jgi:iron complex transport system substrate-binding protein
MRLRKWLCYGMVLCLSLVLMFGLVGCAASQSPADQPSPKAAGTKYPVKVKDMAGEVATIKKQPERIVSLIPSNTEIAYALHLDKEMVGVTTNDDYPPQVKKLPKVGDFNINVEQVVALKPDLVLANTANDKQTIDRLKKLGIPVLVLGANSIQDVYRSINAVAKATNHTKEADQLISQMEKERKEIADKIAGIPKNKRAKVWIELDPNLFTTGGDTFMNELVTEAGGQNVAAGLKGWPKVSPEQVVKWNPDVIISFHGGEKEILSRPGWSSIQAVKNNRVYSLKPDLTNRPGPRIFQGVKQIAALLYPDRFGGKTK